MSTAPADADDAPWVPPLGPADAVVPMLLMSAYALTATQTLQGHDNPEYVSLSVLGGTAHPPGYPLYTLALRLWGHLPVDNVAFRAALLSGVCMALAAFCLSRALMERSGAGAFTSRIAALAFGLTLPAWRMAGVAEAFAPLALNAAALCWLCNYIDNEESLKTWHGALLGGLLGVGVAHHHSLALLLPLV